MALKTIDSISFAGKRALIRVDFNVPLDKQFQVTDDTRIRAALPTIQKVIKDGGSIVLMSHLGRPLKKLNEDGSINYNKHSLKHVLPALVNLLGVTVKFATDCVNEESFTLSSNLKAGEVLLLENLRFYKEEEKGDPVFAEKLAQHGDIYVNDAFGTAHRAHASTTIVANYFSPENKVFGYLMAAEVANAYKVYDNAEKPFTAIIGGAKVSDKILILENLLNKANNILIGGGMAYTFLKALNKPIGKSLCEEDKLDVALEVLKKAKEKGVNIYLPSDHVVADKFDANAEAKSVPIEETPAEWLGLDIAENSIEEYVSVILNSKTILWNGPMGVFEFEKFQKGTVAVAKAVAETTAKGAFSLVGGGDSVAAVNQFGLADKVSYVSTGGGALLEIFEGKILPGVQAIS